MAESGRCTAASEVHPEKVVSPIEVTEPEMCTAASELHLEKAPLLIEVTESGMCTGGHHGKHRVVAPASIGSGTNLQIGGGRERRKNLL